MSNVPAGLRYTQSHEWLKPESGGLATIGITDYAQGALGDITYVQLPPSGARFKAGEVLGVVESVKAASDLYAPVGGEVVAANGDLASAPEALNRDPYGAGWLIRLRLANPAESQALLDAAAYERLLG